MTTMNKLDNIELCQDELQMKPDRIIHLKQGIHYVDRETFERERACIQACVRAEYCHILGFFNEIKKRKVKEPIKREWWDYKKQLSGWSVEEFMKEKEEEEERQDRNYQEWKRGKKRSRNKR